MFKTTIISAIAVAAMAFTASAHAEGGKPYVGVGGAYVDFGDDMTFSAISLSGGIQINKTFAVEAEGAFGATKKTISYGGYDIDVKLDHNATAYLVGTWPISANTDFTARLGYTQMQVSGSTAGHSVSLDYSGAAYGVGVRYFPKGGKNGVRADFTRYNFGDDGNVNAYQVAYVRKF